MLSAPNPSELKEKMPIIPYVPSIPFIPTLPCGSVEAAAIPNPKQIIMTINAYTPYQILLCQNFWHTTTE